jgi:predicted nucleotidyltransferase
LLTLIHSLDAVTRELDIPYFIIGATARDILMEHVYGLDTSRATRDIDFAVAISSWDEFDRLKAQLIATGTFAPSEKAHRLTFGDGPGAYPLDLVPFAGVEQDGEIAWPPKGEFVMNVTGYADAYESALEVELEAGFGVKIVSLPSMAILKILAWNDRPEFDKHASDVFLLLRNYYQAGQFDRLYDTAFGLLQAYDYDLELAGAALLGQDAKRDVVQAARVQVTDVFANEKSFARFSSQMLRSQGGSLDRATLFLKAFLQEIRS